MMYSEAEVEKMKRRMTIEQKQKIMSAFLFILVAAAFAVPIYFIGEDFFNFVRNLY